MTSWNLSSTWWSHGNFPWIVVFVQVIVWPCFFYIMFWLLFSSQKHDYNIVIAAYVQLCMFISSKNPKWYWMFLMLSQLNHGKRDTNGSLKKKSERMAPYLILVKRIIPFYKWLFIIKKIMKSLPPNSAVLLSLPDVLKLLARYWAVCSLVHYFQCLESYPPWQVYYWILEEMI